ncbi:hypothetical protein H0H93_006869, partial [Arthromyces matolae]
SSLDPAKLEYLNKHHLFRVWSTPDGLRSLAERAHNEVKAAFPSSSHTSVEYIQEVILTLQGRIVNIHDIVSHGAFFFQDLDLESEKAKDMLKRVEPQDRLKILQAVIRVVESTSQDVWESTGFLQLLEEEQKKLSFPYKTFMTVLRHALCGQKDGPALGDVARLIGRDRTLQRLSQSSEHVGLQ